MTRTNYDSDFCGSLPIHLINLIQPYGALIVIEKKSNKIIQVSENAGEIFGCSISELINNDIGKYLSGDSVQLLTERMSADIKGKIPGVWRISGRQYLTIMHRKEEYILVEIDREVYDEKKQQTFVSVYQEIRIAINLIQSSTNVQEVVDHCARELKRISGFDKVMLYQFDPEWNGRVIAEVLEEGMESYRGITFPASDVPKQARQLYHKNPFRLIPTREYQPVKLYPVINPLTQAFIDLSDCNVRSVAAVHLEYLKNMGVMASMSTRILADDKLWGLIACHHRTEKYLSFEMCSVFELLSDIISAKIWSLQNNEFHVLDVKVKEQYKNLVEEAYRDGDLHRSLLHGEPDILTLFSASGAVISNGGKLYTKGAVPDKEKIREFILWLHSRQLRQCYHTDRLPYEYDQAMEFKEIGSGVLVIPIDFENDEYVILFRREVVRVVNWGGNPEERIQFDKEETGYHPRNSFRKWQQMVDGTSAAWRREELAAAESLRSFIFEFAE